MVPLFLLPGQRGREFPAGSTRPYCWQPTCLLGPVFRSGLKQERDLSPITCLSPLYLLLWPFPRYEQKRRLNQWLKPECCRTESLPVLPASTTGSSVSDARILWEGTDISFPSKWKASARQLLQEDEILATSCLTCMSQDLSQVVSQSRLSLDCSCRLFDFTAPLVNVITSVKFCLSF